MTPTTPDHTEDPGLSPGFSYIDDPIVAVSSGAGPAAIAVIRFSGRHSHKLIEPCLKTVHAIKERMMTLARFVDDATGVVLDEPLVVFFSGPRSFTGEDSGEIHLHGGPFLVKRALDVLYRLGFRAANPGEFTQRAFLNGKLDLTAAEGIRELVNAQSHQQWLAARQLASGKLASTINDLRMKVIEALAFLEARIDFPDEGDTQDVSLEAVKTRVQTVLESIDRLINSFSSGQVAADGLSVALVGSPNAGKSTLMNTLLGRERAIVTDIAGTTRDYLEERCLIDGRLIRLLDTAGLRTTDDQVEKLGVEASMRLAKEADLIIWLKPFDQLGDEDLKPWLDEVPKEKLIVVTSKADLAEDKLGDEPASIAISCRTGTGIDQLTKAIAAKVDEHVSQLDEEAAFVTSARHLHALKNARKALVDFFTAYDEGAYDECLGFELQIVARELAAIIGSVDSEDVLDKVFSEFCVGK